MKAAASMRTTATTDDEYIATLSGWQQALVRTLRDAVRKARPAMEPRIKWGHIVFFLDGPVLLIRAEETRVLFGFWRGRRLRSIEPRLKASGKYEMATIVLGEGDSLPAATIRMLAAEAAKLNVAEGDPTKATAAA